MKGIRVKIPNDKALRAKLADIILKASEDAHRRGDRTLADALSDVGKSIKRDER